MAKPIPFAGTIDGGGFVQFLIHRLKRGEK